AGADADDPQAILWRRVAKGREHRARRIQQYLDRFEGAERPLPDGLPLRLSTFATLNVSPDVLRVIATQARVGTLHCFVPSPAKDYWGDPQRARTLPDGRRLSEGPLLAGGENRLLQACVAAGVDFMRLAASYEVVHASAAVHAHADRREGAGAAARSAAGASLLPRLQSDIHLRRGEPGRPRRAAVDKVDACLPLP